LVSFHAGNILTFAIALDGLSSIEHAPPDSRNNLGLNQNRIRFRLGLRELARNIGVSETPSLPEQDARSGLIKS
jgi:hypothetical protein